MELSKTTSIDMFGNSIFCLLQDDNTVIIHIIYKIYIYHRTDASWGILWYFQRKSSGTKGGFGLIYP
jgi:hypothetical protein